MATTNTNKPITAAFQLQTKIRLIIQDLMNATVKKLSTLTEKVDKFEDFFIVYQEKIQMMSKTGEANSSAVHILSENLNTSKQELTEKILKVDEKFERIRVENSQIKEEMKQINKKLATITRHNESLNNQFGKAKAKFLEYSDIISSLKEEVSWKISKYVEETIHMNTEIKMHSQTIKKDYFNVTLSIDKQKQKYEEIYLMNEEQIIQSNNITKSLQAFADDLHKNQKSIQKTIKLINTIDNQLNNKNKQIELKYDAKLEEILRSNQSMKKSVQQIQQFSNILENIRQQSQLNYRTVLKKIEDIQKKTKQNIEAEILVLNKDKLKMEKGFDKRINQIQNKQQRNQDFFLHKLQYLKSQIQSELSSKTTALLEQKTKNQKDIASDTISILTQKINSFSSQSRKSINRVEDMVRELRTQTKQQIQEAKIDICEKVERKILIEMKEGGFVGNGNGGGGGSSIIIQQRMVEIQKSLQGNLQKLYEKLQQSKEALVKANEQSQNLQKLVNSNLTRMEEHLNQKIEKLMFLLTKMRGDSIIRNEFTDREIKEIKKHYVQFQNQLQPLLKFIPAFGQIINIIMCLIFDAEYQHSRIIQDNLPQLQSNIEKFNTIIEGNIYEFKEKKKPGVICYRHKEFKKIDIVRAAYTAYLSLWDSVYELEFRNLPHMIPKGFFKKYIEKNIGVKQTKVNINTSKQIQSNNNEGMNQSFHVRRTKNNVISKSKEDVALIREDNKFE